MNQRRRRRRAKMRGPYAFYDVDFLIRWIKRSRSPRVVLVRRALRK